MVILALWCLGLPMIGVPVPGNAQDWQSELRTKLKNGGMYVEDSSGRMLFAHRPDEYFVPASTMKVPTSLCGLLTLGEGYRFATKLFVDGDKALYVLGSGDPGLISEELRLMAQAIAAKVRHVQRIVIDTTLFSETLALDGRSNTLNPYDAPNGAFLVNFNTVNVVKDKKGGVRSAEPQTPLTAIAIAAAKALPPGTHRINIGKDVKKGSLYGGEVLTALLREAGVTVGGGPALGKVPQNATPLLVFQSSPTLKEVVRGLLKYSTNYTTNQLFLTLGVQRYGAPATAEKAKNALNECFTERLKLVSAYAEDGAGLSRKNRFTPREMVKVLRLFEPYRELLHTEQQFQAKTGTLTGVNTLAGYFELPGKGLVRFAILVNSEVPNDYRYQLARILYGGLIGR